MTNPSEQLARRIACAEIMGLRKLNANDVPSERVAGMELICNICHAVCTVGGYGWEDHESCGPMGGECFGLPISLCFGGWFDPDRKIFSRIPPDPETNPADALALLEVMKKKGFRRRIEDDLDDPTYWLCTLIRFNGKWIYHYGRDESLCLAIVSAVLKSEGKG